MPVLDTGLLIDLLKGKPELANIIKSIGENNLSTTVFNKYELLRGAGRANIGKVKELLDKLTIYEFSEEAMQESVKIYKNLKERGKSIGEIDILVAGTSFANGELLYAGDRDFENIDSPYVKLV